MGRIRTHVRRDWCQASQSCGIVAMSLRSSRCVMAPRTCACSGRLHVATTDQESDVDFLVDGGERFGRFDLAALRRELEDVLGCPVHVTTTSGLRHAREHTEKRSSAKRYRFEP